MKRFDDWPDANQTYQRRPGVYAILPFQGGLLATFQGGIHNEFQLPGGGVDPGEQPLTALHREVFEETGWIIQQPRLLTRFKRFVYMPDYDLWAEKICMLYVARPVKKKAEPLEVDHKPAFLTAQNAVHCLANAGDRDAVRSFFGVV